MNTINIIIDKDRYGVAASFIVRTNQQEFEDGIDRAKNYSSAKRLEMIGKVRAAIRVGNAFIDEHPNQVAKCPVWANLMDDCVILAMYEYAHNALLVEVATDEEFSQTIAESASPAIDPKLKEELK